MGGSKIPGRREGKRFEVGGGVTNIQFFQIFQKLHNEKKLSSPLRPSAAIDDWSYKLLLLSQVAYGEVRFSVPSICLFNRGCSL